MIIFGRRITAGAVLGLALVVSGVVAVMTPASAATPKLTGHLDSISTVSMGEIRATGWAADTAHLTAPVGMAAYVDGAGHPFSSALPRSDVQAHLNAPQNKFGFSAALLVSGTHQVCVYALAVDGRSNHLLGCKTVSFPVNPIAHVDQIVADCNSLETGHPRWQVTGWVFDPDARGGPGSLDIYTDLHPDGDPNQPNDVRNTLRTTISRPDVAKAYGLANNTVGFKFIAGGQQVRGFRLYPLNTKGTGSNIYLTSLADYSRTHSVPCAIFPNA